MLSIGLVKSAGDATRYYEKDDYYAPDSAAGDSEHGRDGGDVQGRWGGRGAAALGLIGGVGREQFQAVLQGHLTNGEVLGRNRGDRIEHTPGWDLTFSAPKSISILAEVGGDTRLLQAHERAVDRALAWIEDNALGTRERAPDGMRFEPTASLVVAKFTHHTSRNQDPALHTHSVVINATQDAQGAWKSVHSMELFRHKMVAGQVYRSALAREVLSLGYHLQVNGKDGTFELREVPVAYREQLSSRRAQVAEKLAQWGSTDPERAARAAILTRQRKQDIPHGELVERWREDAAARGLDVDRWVEETERRGASEPSHGLALAPALREAKERLAEGEAVFAHGELLRQALRLSLGRTVVEEVESAARDEARDGTLLRADDGHLRRWSTPRARAQEQRSLDIGLKSTAEPFLTPSETRQAMAARTGFTHGQREALQLVLATDSAHMAILGRPGTGKTTMLAALREVLQARRVEVRGTAQNAAAAKNLESEAGIPSVTVHRHLREIGEALVRARRGQEQWWHRLLKPRELWVVDEASQLSNALTARLLWAADTLGVRVLFVGDNKQLAAIEAGRPFDLLLKNGLRHVEMDEILRQQHAPDRAAVRAAVRGDVKSAIAQLAPRLSEQPDRTERLQAMVNDWASRPVERGSTLLLTSRNDDRDALNDAARQVLRREGALRGEQPRVALEKEFGSRADTRETHFYRAGQLLQFTANDRSLGIAAGEYLRVTAVDQERGLVTLERDGTGVLITWRPRENAPRRARPVVAYRERETTLAAGERIRWTRNAPQLQLVNGETLTVRAVTRELTSLERADGTVVDVDAADPDSQHWTHAYASTVYRSQGLTTRHAIANLDSGSGRLMSQKAFLVAISRHRESVAIHTDDVKELAQRLLRFTGEKTSAIAELDRFHRTRDHQRHAPAEQQRPPPAATRELER
jgi:conjugative relaxase-like TrwC/TraI family protein